MNYVMLSDIFKDGSLQVMANIDLLTHLLPIYYGLL